MTKPMAVGVIGCGMISHAYLGTIARAPTLSLHALASQSGLTAQRQAERYGGVATTVDALLADPSIDIIVNLAPPAARHELGRRILQSGKHLYSEKPFATSMEEAGDLLAYANERGLVVGCAPDTFLAGGIQTARRLIDEGAIGRVVGGSIAMGTAGIEGWHPDPGFFYAKGGGPLLDIGPYYITQLVNLLGPVAQVTAFATIPQSERIARAPGREGQRIAVVVPTTVNGALLLANGANIALSMSWDIVAHQRPPIELYGETGTLLLSDPNHFGPSVQIFQREKGWTSIGPEVPVKRVLDDATIARAVAAMGRGIDPVTGGPVDRNTGLRMGNLRGVGIVEMAAAITAGHQPRASGALAAHVLEVLLGLEMSARDKQPVTITSTAERPAPYVI
jgi:hypothetical protein